MRWPLFVMLAACKAASLSYLSPQVSGDHESSLGGLDTKLATAMLASYHQQTQHEPPPVSLAPTDGSELQLRALSATISIEGPLAHTELHLTFHNAEARAREGRFSITLPTDAAVAKFAMKNGAQWREARIVTREQGRAVYESFLHKRVDPALLEQDLGNQFSARVFPIAASSDKEIIIAYDHRVGSEPYTLALKGLPPIDALSIAIDRDGERSTRATHAVAPEDLVVPTRGGDLAVAARDAFVARVELPEASEHVALDHVLILVDTSASRATIMGKQVDVVQHLLLALPADSTVVLAAYDQGVTEIARGTAREVAAAATKLHEHGALGASDLGAALAFAANAGLARVILVGDGAPTLGEHEPTKLAQIIGSAAGGGTAIERVDALRVGSTIDQAALHPIVAAARSPGAIFDSRDLVRALHGLTSSAPTERAIAVDGATAVFPASTRGLAPGEPVWVFGTRAVEQRDAPLAIHIGDRLTTLAPKLADAARVERAVAGAKIAELTEQLGTMPADKQPAAGAEIEQIALANNLVSARTSLLVLENDDQERMMLGAPTIDPTATTQGITIDKNYINNIPVPGRTFEAALGSAAGVSFSGSSSLENQYYVDGVNTTGLTFGGGEEVMLVSAREPVDEAPFIDDPRRIVRDMTEQALEDRRWTSEPTKEQHEPPYAGPMKQVMTALHDGRRMEALEIAAAWQLRNPGEVAALMALGEALEARGSTVLAARAYGSLLDLYPNRAELLRAAGERLDRVYGARPLAIDAYRRALRERPDQASTYRLLAYDLMRDDNPEALDVIEAGIYHGRQVSVQNILQQDANTIAAYLAAHVPAKRAELQARRPITGKPSLRIVLSWETDGNDVDLHVTDRHGDHAYYDHRQLASGGQLLDDITDGFGPEMFVVESPSAGPYKLGVNYYARGPEGIGLGSVQIIRQDGAGHVSIEDRPFVIQNDHAYVDLGTAE